MVNKNFNIANKKDIVQTSIDIVVIGCIVAITDFAFIDKYTSITTMYSISLFSSNFTLINLNW